MPIDPFADPALLEQLRSLANRMVKVRAQCKAADEFENGGRYRPKAEMLDDDTPAVVLLASMRLSVEVVELSVAQRIPTTSRTPRKQRAFRGVERMSPEVGRQVYADSQRMARADLMRKWCIDTAQNRYGVAGGQGIYTRNQVRSALSNRVGAHLVRRGVTV